MYCSQCGKEIEEDSKFCIHCGNEISHKLPKGEPKKVSPSSLGWNTYEKVEPPTLWAWYFGWRWRTFLTLPIFLYFAYSGFWFIWIELADIISFFQHTPVSWFAIFLIFIFGSILIWFLLAPIYVSFCSISWIYEINIDQKTKWKKFLYSLGIICLVLVGMPLLRDLTAWVLGIISK